MATVKPNYAEIIARTTKQIEDTRNELEKYEAQGLDAVAEIMREKIKDAEQFVEQLKKNLQAESRQRVPKDFTASAPPASVIQLYGVDYSSGILPGADGGDGFESLPEDQSTDSDVASLFDPEEFDNSKPGSDDEKTGSDFTLRLSDADNSKYEKGLNSPAKPVPAIPSVAEESSRGSRSSPSEPSGSSPSDPLRYSAAALGIRVMSAAESAERAAVEAADAERRANFFRANGLAP